MAFTSSVLALSRPFWVDSSLTVLPLYSSIAASSALAPETSSPASALACRDRPSLRKCPLARLSVIGSSLTAAPGVGFGGAASALALFGASTNWYTPPSSASTATAAMISLSLPPPFASAPSLPAVFSVSVLSATALSFPWGRVRAVLLPLLWVVVSLIAGSPVGKLLEGAALGVVHGRQDDDLHAPVRDHGAGVAPG